MYLIIIMKSFYTLKGDVSNAGSLVFFRRSPLDFALAEGHRECADFIVTAGGYTRGGRFHRAVTVLQAVWKFKKQCVRKASTMIGLVSFLFCFVVCQQSC